MRALPTRKEILDCVGLALDALYSLQLDCFPILWTFSPNRGPNLSVDSEFKFAAYFILSLVIHASKRSGPLSLTHLSNLIQICFDIMRANVIFQEVGHIIANTLRDAYSLDLIANDIQFHNYPQIDYQILNLIYMELQINNKLKPFWQKIWDATVLHSKMNNTNLFACLYQHKMSFLCHNANISPSYNSTTLILNTMIFRIYEFKAKSQNFNPIPLTMRHVLAHQKFVAQLAQFIRSLNGENVFERQKAFLCLVEMERLFERQCFHFAYCLLRHCQNNPATCLYVIASNQEILKSFSLCQEMTRIMQELNCFFRPSVNLEALYKIQFAFLQDPTDLQLISQLFPKNILHSEGELAENGKLSVFDLNAFEIGFTSLLNSPSKHEIAQLIKTQSELFKSPVCNAFFSNNFDFMPFAQQQIFLAMFREYLHLAASLGG